MNQEEIEHIGEMTQEEIQEYISKMNQEEIAEFREEVKNGEALGKAREFYQKILIELGVREDNQHVGSGWWKPYAAIFSTLSSSKSCSILD